jgi:quinolinate synthase
MEYVAAGDIPGGGVHMLGTGGMLRHVSEHSDGDFNVATETGMLHPLRKEAPWARLTAANPKAVCKYMKMITLPKLRDSLGDQRYEVKVPAESAERARVPIERIVAIG